MQLLAKQMQAESQLSILECAIRFGFPVVLRTDGRTEESDVITLPKFSGIDGLPNFPTHADPCLRLLHAELRY